MIFPKDITTRNGMSNVDYYTRSNLMLCDLEVQVTFLGKYSNLSGERRLMVNETVLNVCSYVLCAKKEKCVQVYYETRICPLSFCCHCNVV